MLNRRSFGFGCVAAGALGTRAVAGTDAASQISVLEASLGGRIGVAALDTGSGKLITHRGSERFAMCSTFKWLLAATVLARSEKDTTTLDQHVAFTDANLPSHSPVTRQHLREGAMSIRDLCSAAVEESDNGAANLLLHEIGGPAAVTDYARSLGDEVTRLDRFELALNENRPGDPRDTTTPEVTVRNLEQVLVGNALRSISRELLIGWMKNCRTGIDRLRSGLPKDWIVGDKTGTGTGSGPTSAANDVAIAWPPRRAPILIAGYISGSSAPLNALNIAHARIGRIVASTFG